MRSGDIMCFMLWWTKKYPIELTINSIPDQKNKSIIKYNQKEAKDKPTLRETSQNTCTFQIYHCDESQKKKKDLRTGPD